MNKINFNERVVIVTGAGSGLGKSYAMEFSRRGAKVVVNDIGLNEESCSEKFIKSADEVVFDIKKMGGEAIANYDDIATFNGGSNLVSSTIDKFGKVDILINNAGILEDTSFFKMKLAQWKKIIDIHLNGVYNVTHSVFKNMKKNCYGKIIMTTSAAGLYGNFGQVNYSAAKMSLIGLMNSLKLEAKKYNITVNSIAPIAASNLTKNIFTKDIFNRANPSLVASLILYLCSEKCLDSGGIYNVGMGYLNKVVISSGPWINIENESSDCSPETVFDRWEEISTLKEKKEFEEASQMFIDLLKIVEI